MIDAQRQTERAVDKSALEKLKEFPKIFKHCDTHEFVKAYPTSQLKKLVDLYLSLEKDMEKIEIAIALLKLKSADHEDIEKMSKHEDMFYSKIATMALILEEVLSKADNISFLNIFNNISNKDSDEENIVDFVAMGIHGEMLSEIQDNLLSLEEKLNLLRPKVQLHHGRFRADAQKYISDIKLKAPRV